MPDDVQKVAFEKRFHADVARATIIAMMFGPILLAQSTQPTTSSQSPEDVVRAAWDTMRQGDDQALEQLIGPQGEEQGHLRGGLARVMTGIEHFDRAMIQRYGRAKSPRFGSADRLPTLRLSAQPTAGGFVTVSANEPGAPAEIQLIRQNGQWRLTFHGIKTLLTLRQVDLPMPNDEAIRRMNEMGEAIRAAAKDVLARQYPTADAAQQAGREALDDASRGKYAQ